MLFLSYLVDKTVGRGVVEVRSGLSTQVLSHCTRPQAGRVSDRIPGSTRTPCQLARGETKERREERDRDEESQEIETSAAC